MGDSAINYLGENGKSWSPIRGCSRVSEGCRNCWAERMAIRFAGWKLRDASKAPRTETPGLTHGLVRSTSSGPHWTGEVRLIERDLDAPLRWGGAQRIAVCFGGDLFHEKVKREWIVEAFGVMAVAGAREYANATGGCFHRPADGMTFRRCGETIYRWPKHLSGPHTFLVLTKRAPRMRELLSSGSFREEVSQAACRWAHNRRDAGYLADCIASSDNPCATGRAGRLWPLPNVWCGVSVESADYLHRIADLLATPAAVRWVSLEPMLGPMDVSRWLPKRPYHFSDCPCLDCLDRRAAAGYPTETPYLSWLVIGGESGPGARPCDVAWIRSVVAQGRAAGVPVYVKQLGACSTGGTWLHDARANLRDRKGADPSEWPEDLRAREMPHATAQETQEDR